MELWKKYIRHIDMATTSSQTGKTVAVRDEPVLETPSSPSSLSSGSQAEHEFEYLESDNVATQEDIPPDGGYGWVVTACVFIINAHTWGINSVRTEPPIQISYSHEVSIAELTKQSWAVFLAHYLSNSTFPGATELQYALIGGLSISQALLVSPLVSLSNRKLGTRPTLLIGTVLVFGSMLSASFATKIWHLFLSQGVCFGYGMGFLYITATSILPKWFARRRSLVLGIASAGAGIGGLAYNLGAGVGVEKVGLSWTYRILAFCSLAMNLIGSVLLKDRKTTTSSSLSSSSSSPSSSNDSKAFDLRDYGRVQVVLVVVWGLLTELGFITLLYSLPNYATSIGLSARQGSVIGAMLNLGLGVGRPLVGYYSDVLGRINMASIMTCTCGVLCLAIWVPAKTFPVLIIFALLSGSVMGTFWTCFAPVTAEVVGMQKMPSTLSMICFSLVVPTTFAEPIALELVSSFGYLSSQIFVGCMFLGGAASTLALRSWKIHEIEMKAQNESDTPGHRGFWLTPRRLFMTRKI